MSVTGHVAAGKDWCYRCTCGRTGPFWTTKQKAQHQAGQHERYCSDDGEAELIHINSGGSE